MYYQPWHERFDAPARWRRELALFCWLWIGGICAAQDLPPAAKPVAAEMLGQAEIIQFESGDLDGDGIADLAIVAAKETSRDIAIGVLRGRAGNRFEKWALSPYTSPMQRAPEVRIRARALVVAQMRTGMNWTSWLDSTYRWRGGRFRLVGEDWIRQEPRFPADAEVFESTSKNYLTGKTIERWKAAGAKMSHKTRRETDLKPAYLEDLELD